MLAPGRTLGRYELLRPLAEGGMAEVYLARRRVAGIEKRLVIKRMRPGTTGDPRYLELFVREARLSMSLVHQNIVPVFDFGRIDDQVFLAMERVEGSDLGLGLARAADHRLPPLLAAFVAAECCQALDYAHRRKAPGGAPLGIVHRDVTPRNVLLSWSGEVKLTDFGIAALAGDAGSRLLGTPRYMAPEQARNEPVDARADLYAIGLVLREAVTGVRSRAGRDRETILEAARRAELVPWPACGGLVDLALGSGDCTPGDCTAGDYTTGNYTSGAAMTDDAPIPAALVAVVERATAARPDDRYPDARSMLEDLDSFIVGQRAAHRAASPARQLAAWLAGVWGTDRDDRAEICDTADTADGLATDACDGASPCTMLSLLGTALDDTEVSGSVPVAQAAIPPRTPGSLRRAARSTRPRRTRGPRLRCPPSTML
jgi:serine/threonine protein kinase